jgi:hypothetical protein
MLDFDNVQWQSDGIIWDPESLKRGWNKRLLTEGSSKEFLRSLRWGIETGQYCSKDACTTPDNCFHNFVRSCSFLPPNIRQAVLLTGQNRDRRQTEDSEELVALCFQGFDLADSVLKNDDCPGLRQV